MEQKQLDGLVSWFDNYVGSFYGNDEFINTNLKLKEEHSKRVCQEMLYLADELKLETNQRLIAQATALLHDIGRFPQFIKYGTYNDVKSTNHCLLSLDVLRKEKTLDDLEPDEQEQIEKAIEHHGQRQLPSDLDNRYLQNCQLIRDADKLDVFYVVITAYKQYMKNPQDFMLEIEFPDEPRCSAHIVKAIMNTQLIDYSTLETLNDVKLLQLGWVYDVNFTATLKRLKEHKLLEQMVSFLPKNEETERIKEKIFDYVNRRIKQDGQ